jgi:pyruvate,orthophosphate dikinase
VILVRPDIDTADVAGFAAASGALTTIGGRTAHASLIARQMGKPCVVSCAGLEVDAAAWRAKIDATLIAEGDWLSIDGARWRQSKPGVPGRPTRARPHWRWQSK